MWLIIFAVVMAALIAGIAYLTVAACRFGLIQKVSEGKKWLGILISLGVIVILFTAAALVMDFTNAVIVLVFTFLFFLLFGIIGFAAEKISGKSSKINWPGWLALLSTIIYFSAGYYLCNNVWQTDYDLKTDKSVGRLKIAMFADSHIGATFDGKGFAAELKKINRQHPDIVLVPGDYVDDWSNKEDMKTASAALGKMKAKYGVWFSYGNHDEGMFNDRNFTAAELESELEKNGVHVLADSYELVDDRFYVVCRKDSSVSPDRMSMDDLLKGIDTEKYVIVLDHEPNDYDNEAASDADLVLSGHTHGGQLFPFNKAGEWFNINDRTYGYERRKGTDFIVTSGISDWAILFKTGTKSEYVIIDLEGKN